jgi:ribosomal protein S27AE
MARDVVWTPDEGVVGRYHPNSLTDPTERCSQCGGALIGDAVDYEHDVCGRCVVSDATMELSGDDGDPLEW